MNVFDGPHMNRAQRRAMARGFQPVPADDPVHLEGTDCPYCEIRCVPDDDLLYRCNCGWSGILLQAKR